MMRPLSLCAVAIIPLACQAHDPAPLVARSTPVVVAPVAVASPAPPLPLAPPPAGMKPESPVVDTERKVLSEAGAPAVPAVPWDKKTPPAFLDAVIARYGLSREERAHLEKSGFVVLGRERGRTFSNLYWEVHRAQLPIYVSIDSLFHALYSAHEDALKDLEVESFWPRLVADVDAMRRALPAAAPNYPTETVRDLDLYLRVAQSLFDYPVQPDGPAPQEPARFADDDEVKAFVTRAQQHTGVWTGPLFGRNRSIDFGGFTPRGHYGLEEGVSESYFEGTMWLSRIEFNVVTRSSRSSSVPLDPRETPREALDAFALADLAKRAHVDSDLADIDQTWGRLAGAREDMAPSDLVAVEGQAGVTDLSTPGAFEQLRVAIGSRFRRTVRTHVTAAGSVDLPVTATLLPPRIVPDAAALMPLTKTPDAADVAYLLGQERAKGYLDADSRRNLLDEGRAVLRAAPRPGLYGAWLGAVMGLSEPARGIVPSFVSTPEFGDLRMDSALAAFGQLRHAHVLVTGEAFAESGCLIPTGYVEPAPAALDRLALAADEAARVFDVPNLRVPEQTRPTVEAFQRMAQTFRVLRAIVGHELEGRPLTDGENLYLAQVVEGRPVNPYMMQREHLDGWYYRMFQNLRSARRPAAFVADYFFTPDTGTAAYVGGDEPRIGVFVVDTGGQPRVVVGPVAHAYERHERGARLSDQSDAPPPKMLSRWSKSYEVGVQPEVGILDIGRGPEPGAFIVKPRGLAPAALGHVRVEEVDIHDHPCSGVDVTLGKAPVRFVLPDAVCERPDNGRAFRLRKNGIVLTDSTLAESASTARSASELD